MFHFEQLIDVSCAFERFLELVQSGFIGLDSAHAELRKQITAQPLPQGGSRDHADGKSNGDDLGVTHVGLHGIP